MPHFKLDSPTKYLGYWFHLLSCMIYGPSDVKTDAKPETQRLPTVPSIQNVESSPELQPEAQVQG